MASIISAGTTSGTSLNLSGDTSGVLQLATNGSTTAVTVDTSQRVGIGTASPSQPLTVRTSGTSTSAGGNIAARIESNGSGYASTLQFSDNVANSSYISMVGSATAFGQAGTERMRIDSSGNVGIGTTSPASKLDVVGSASITSFTGTTALGSTIRGATSSNDYSGIDFRSGGASSGGVPIGRIAVVAGGGGSSLSFGTSNSYGSGITNTAMTVNPSGNVQFLATIGVGNATPSTSGAGITFPATQSASTDANTLDDYEEGTWSPVATAQSGSITSYTSTGQYTKIGRNVFLTCVINLTNVGTASGRMTISNMPFTALDLSNGRPAVFVGRENAVTGIPVVGWMNGNQTSAEIASLSFTGITWTNNYAYTMSITYQQI